MNLSSRAETGPDSPSALGEFFREGAVSLSGRTETVIVTVPAPVAHPAFLSRTLPSRHAFIWQPADGAHFAGTGAAFSIETGGETRFGGLRKSSESLWKSLKRIAHPACEERAPALFGGFAFHSRAENEPSWEGFPGCSFVLPRWCYGTDGRSGWLALALHGSGDRDRIDSYLNDYSRILEGAAAGPPTGEPFPAVTDIREMGRKEWAGLVEKIRAAIRDENLSKVVAARRSTVRFAGPVDPLAVYERIGRSCPDCHRFLFQRGGASFLGASPERLVQRAGREIRSEALAGSARAADSEEENRLSMVRLLESKKDLGEHELVVEMIRRKLGAFCAELHMPARPQVRRLRTVLHLHTPMTGVLARETHVLDLAAALHPTPSVGGVPTADAVRWIAENEPEARGWYAGIVGWADPEGNGDLVTAIRSALLRERTAHVYAGGGIVLGSDPDAEYEETRIKMGPMLSALGVID